MTLAQSQTFVDEFPEKVIKPVGEALGYLGAEIVVAVGILVVLLADLFLKREHSKFLAIPALFSGPPNCYHKQVSYHLWR